MPEKCSMTAATLAKGIKVRKAVISSLLNELEEAWLIDVFYLPHGNYSNPKRLVVKIMRRRSRRPILLLNAIYIGFPIQALDRNLMIEVYLKSKLPIVPFEPMGKRPVMDLYSWQRLSLTEKFDFFFDDQTLNVGLRLPSNLCVVDVDVKDHAWSELSAFRQTLTVATARGFHYYFLSDPVVNVTTTGVLPHIDTRCKGSFVVIPPSVHQSGAPYTWANVAKLQELPIAFRREWRRAYFSSFGTKGGVQLPNIIPEGARNDSLWRLGRSLRARGYGYDEIAAELQAANSERCSPNLSRCELDKLIEHVWRHPNRI